MDFTKDADLVAAANRVLEVKRNTPSYEEWTRSLSEHISKVQAATEEEFRSESFLMALWESEAISATGQGTVTTAPFLMDKGIIDIFWQVKSLNGQRKDQAFAAELDRLRDAVIGRIKELGSRIPRLKLTRVFAALQPKHFSSLADVDALDEFAKMLGVRKPRGGIAVLHQRILDRLDHVWAAIQIPPGDRPELARMKLPWLIFEAGDAPVSAGVTVQAGDKPGAVRLSPLPANRRRRGLKAFAGWLPTILAMLQFVKDGCSREDFREHVRSVNPRLKPESVDTHINALIGEWGVLSPEGDRLVLTPRGEAFLESEDPDDLSDWLLTQILGFDNLLHLLRQGPFEQKSLLSALQKVNPNWGSTRAPNALITCLRALKLTDSTDDRKVALTPRGTEWASRIHWVPGVVDEPTADNVTLVTAVSETQPTVFERPNVDQLLACFPKEIVFNRKLVAQLDAALWSHDRRHFVVLSGLSGAGKTKLACCYANALWGNASVDTSEGVFVLPVQPGWHDPSAVLGYVNPLNTDRYVRTGFLNFLLDAVSDPERPYTVVLDEMNLSHPEQYFSSLLSAMETGGSVTLHAEDDEVDEIPPSIPYPSNLLIIGTVNMDETTHGLSDKVLDRASVIEFWDIDTDSYPGWVTPQLNSEHIAQLRPLLKQLNGALSPARLHFGWRTVRDVIGYVSAALAGGVIEFLEAVDQAVYAKVLPKLRGEDSERLRKALADTRDLLKERELSMSLNKVTQLLEDLRLLGSARFWR
jgi:5-methylcytosine-specific restriction enzyme B